MAVAWKGRSISFERIGHVDFPRHRHQRAGQIRPTGAGSSIVENIVALHHARTVHLAAPEYLLVESANVLWKHLQRNNVQIEHVIPSLRILRDLDVRFIPDIDLLEGALEFGANLNIAVYDALFCVLAERENVPLITADAALLRRLSGSSIRAIAPTQWLEQ